MAEVWDTAGKIKMFNEKAVFFRSWPGAFLEKCFIKCELSKYVYLLYSESACRERMMQEISISKQQLNGFPPSWWHIWLNNPINALIVLHRLGKSS